MRRLRDLFLLCFAKSIWKCCEVARFDVLGNKTDGRWQTSYRRLSPRQGWKLQNLSRNFYAWEVKSFPILIFFLLADQEVDQIAESLTNLDSRPDRRSKLWKMNKLVSDPEGDRTYRYADPSTKFGTDKISRWSFLTLFSVILAPIFGNWHSCNCYLASVAQKF